MLVVGDEMLGEVVFAAAGQRVGEAARVGRRQESFGGAVAGAELLGRTQNLAAIDLQILEGIALLIIEHKMQILLETEERDFQPPAGLAAVIADVGEMGILVGQHRLAEAAVDALDGVDFVHVIPSFKRYFDTSRRASSSATQSTNTRTRGDVCRWCVLTICSG